MWVTIYTDASLRSYKEVRFTAYGYWIRCDHGRITRARMCSKEIVTVDQAEMYAIYQAVGAAFVCYKEGATIICVNSDSMNAIKGFRGFRVLRDPVEIRLKQAFDKVRSQKPEVKIIYRHVKAHTGTERSNIKAYLNDWCDKQCKKLTWDAKGRHMQNRGKFNKYRNKKKKKRKNGNVHRVQPKR